MDYDIKSGVGYIIPAAGVVGFFTALFLGQPILSIIIAVAGILVWFIYMLIMESSPPSPSQLGNLIIFFGILLTIGIFMAFGIDRNMFGGYIFKTEGSLVSLIILFFSILTGMLFRNQVIGRTISTKLSSGLTESDREWVKKALEGNVNSHEDKVPPKVIVVKQESSSNETASINNKEKEKPKNLTEPNPSIMNNPYYAYPPPQYYYEEQYEDEDWDDEYYEEE
tara:strand:+ start:43480 stop:44151 length:672 start_codon:yes stop_codon:yes gene_type:complete